MIPMWLKRLVRPLVPDRVMARYRLHQHSRQVRSNVDLLVEDRRAVARWLRVTPDTYRVGVIDEHRGAVADGVVLVGPAADAGLAASALGGSGAAFVAQVGRPGLVGRRRVEPKLQVVAGAIGADTVAVVGPVADRDPMAVHHRVVAAGFPIRVVARQVAHVDGHRRDPVARPMVVMLAGVPMHDIGGGSRGTQLALELVRCGFHVVYAAAFGTHESVDLGLRFVHETLEQYRLGDLDMATLVERAATPGVAIVEIPSPAAAEAVATLGSAGWTRVVDIVDHWADRSLGGDWYDEAVERRLVEQADLVVASAPDLVDRLRRWGVTPRLVPNAVNAEVFGRPAGPPPEDLPGGDGPIFGYHGSLYGDWFDWPATVALARRRPDARLVLIGDPPRDRGPLPDNVHLLGLKPQIDLPDYVRRFTVGLLPFVVSDTTHAVSPLKVFEYLACGVPVAAPPLRAIVGTPGVLVDDDLVAAVERAERSARPNPAVALGEHSWGRRVGSILSGLGIAAPGVSPVPETRIVPTMHYPRATRRL